LKSPYFLAFIYFLFLYLTGWFASDPGNFYAAAWCAAAGAATEMAGISHHY
jgi:uncharacterized membrane protein AbrB (regulator of aidB expression)